MKNLLRHGVALTFAATAAGSVSAADVVVSIKPLHSLVAGVMGDTGSPYLILPGASSPHTYQMRPTQAAEIDQADLIVWVGEELETFLSRPIANLGEGSMVLTAHEFEGLRLYATRAGGIWQDHADRHDEHDHGDGHRDDHTDHKEDSEHHDEHDHGSEEGHHDEHDHGDGHRDDHTGHKEDSEHHDEHDHGSEEGHHDEHDHGDGHRDDHMDHKEDSEHHDEHGHDSGEHGVDAHGHVHGEYDMHIWLDDENARRIVDSVAEALSVIRPENTDVYLANAKMMHDRIHALDASIKNRLEPVIDSGFVVFHDAYQYFERAYGLNGVGTVLVDPSRQIGAKTMSELRNVITENNVTCLFTEPQFKPDLVETLIEGTAVRTGELDPLGADVAPGPDAWFAIMENLANSILNCLTNP